MIENRKLHKKKEIEKKTKNKKKTEMINEHAQTLANYDVQIRN